MRKIVLTFGLIAGFILSVMMVVTLGHGSHLDLDTGAVIGYATMVAAFLMIYFGVRSYRDNVAEGKVTFGRAFKVGILIMLVASTCYVATWQVIYARTGPAFTAKYTELAIAKARAAGATEAQLAEKRAEQEKFWTMYQNPVVRVAFTFLEPLPVGLLFTLVTAGLLSRKRREEGATVA